MNSTSAAAHWDFNTEEDNSTQRMTTYWDYDLQDDNSSDDDAEEQWCDRSGDNHLGAQLSHLYLIMFVLSLLGNGLVLVIIYRRVGGKYRAGQRGV